MIDLNRRIVVPGLLALALLWLGNIYYYREHQLPEPLFMKHFYDLGYGDKISFNLFYLVNRNQKVELAALEIPGYMSVGTFTVDYADYKYYKLMRATVELDSNDVKNATKSDRLVLKDLKVTFSDGKEQKVNVGEINIALDKPKESRFIPVSVSSSSDNTGSSEFDQLGQPVKLNSLKYRFSDLLADGLKFSINGKPVEKSLFPLEIKANERINLKHAFAFDRSDRRAYNFYLLELLLNMETQDGKTVMGSALINNNPSFNSDTELQNLIDERRAP